MEAGTYRGAAALAQSKYASPVHKARMAALASLPPSTPTPGSTALATKSQIAATTTENAVMSATDLNPDAQLAMAQAENLKSSIEAHSSKVEKDLSRAVTMVRTLLSRVRDKLGVDSKAVKPTEDLWEELEKLFELTKASKDILPEFLNRQKDNMSLFHSSVVDETIRDTQEELYLQHKKVNLQHSLILEHQQAFLNYKDTTELKLKERIELQERVSRLTLDKGLLKSELDNQVKQTDTLRADYTEAKKNAETLHNEADNLLGSKKKLEEENSSFTKQIESLKAESSGLSATRDALQEQVVALKSDVAADVEKAHNAEALVKTLNEKVKKLETANDDLETEINELFGKEAELKEVAKALEILKVENDKLSTTIINFQKASKVSHAGDVDLVLVKQETIRYQEQLRAAEEMAESARAEVQQWSSLATRSYNEYQELLPKLNAAEAKAEGLDEKDRELAKLKQELQVAKASAQTNGVSTPSADAAYWKEKYESLVNQY